MSEYTAKLQVHSIRYNARKLFEGFHTTQISREPLLPAYRSAELGEMLVKAMQRNPVNWDDEHILPWNGQERNGMMLELVTRQPVVSG